MYYFDNAIGNSILSVHYQIRAGVAETGECVNFLCKLNIFMLAVTCSKVINLQRKSDSKALHQILFPLGQWALPQAHLGKLTALLQHWRTHGESGGYITFLKIWVSQFVEICIERDRILTKKRLKNASDPSIQAEIAPPPIPNSVIFSGGREDPGIPRQTRA